MSASEEVMHDGRYNPGSGLWNKAAPINFGQAKAFAASRGKANIEHIINKLQDIDIVDKIYIVTNNKFEGQFTGWLHNFTARKPIEIINDGTSSNEDRLGALGDINYVIN